MRLQSHSVANRKISPGERITLGVNTGNIPQTQQWGFFRVPPYPTGTNATKSTRAQFRIATSHIRYMFDRTSAEPRNRISSRYGPRPGVNPINHLGVDFAGNGVNRFTEIRAVYHGRVVWRSTSSSADTGFAIAYELDDVICLVTRRQLIVIKMHLQDNPDVAGTNRPRLVVGSRVVPGQIVGRVGSTGNTGGNPHLCFEVTNAPSGNIWNTSGTHARGYSNRINPLYLFYPRITFTDGSQSSTQCRFWDEEARYRADNNGRTTSCINNSTSCVARIERDGGHDRRRY
ncbi:MAG: peptidoglycan DD-metalloendopeptidase family protein [Oscillospiraceae bacterium]|nr:peptidoglycan DD-metalloendopeptidase family protein [Oscillospiraceae bacterium]